MSDRKPKPEKPAERKPRFTTLSGLPLERLYTPGSLAGWDPRESLSFPGEFPYTRGIYPTMYRSRIWTMRQIAGFGTGEDTNKRFKFLIAQGQTAFQCADRSLNLAGAREHVAD